MDVAIVDTGVWYAMFCGKDGHYEAAQRIEKDLRPFKVIVPWPVLYETLRTSFVKQKVAFEQFQIYLQSPRIERVQDDKYRRDAFDESVALSQRSPPRPISMVDCLVRMMILDVNMNIRYLATFNVGDFADVCRERQVQIIL